jgi:hypothetical protein
MAFKCDSGSEQYDEDYAVWWDATLPTQVQRGATASFCFTARPLVSSGRGVFRYIARKTKLEMEDFASVTTLARPNRL